MNPNPSSILYPPLPLQSGPTQPRKTRVCIASFDFVGPVKNGGVGTAFTSLGEGLAAAGHDVTFLFLAGQWCENRTMDYWVEYYRKKNIRFVPMPASGLNFDTRWHLQKSYEGYLWIRDQNFDVVHFSEWKGPGYYSLLAKQQGLAFAQTVLCVHTHGPTLWHKLSNSEYVTLVDDLEIDFLERSSVRLADVLASPSQYLLRWMIAQGWELPQNCYVEQYLRPATARQPLPEADRLHQIRELVFFGRLEFRKGLVLFCDALDQLKSDPDLLQTQVTFLGKIDKISGRDSAEYVADRAKSWPWKWRVISDRDQAGAMDYLQGSGRLAVLPSLVDNLPNTVLECIGAKVPFVASDAGGIPEIIAPADHEAVCFALRTRAFAAKLRRALLEGMRPAAWAVEPSQTERAWVRWHEELPSQAGLAEASFSVELPGSQPLVSVCVSHWNRPHYLRQALASVEAQDYPNFEVVLVDDGSTSAEAKAYLDELEPRFQQRGWRLLRGTENRYPGAARNLAVQHARGEYLVFLDDDNYAKPHEVSTLVRIARKTGADILTCFLDTFAGQEAPRPDLPPKFRCMFTGADAATGALRNNFGDTNSLIRREVFLALGGFHEDWGVGHEDWEFHAKAVLKGYQLQVVPEALAWYRLNDTEQTVNRKSPSHANHMANIRPYLEAVPPSLRRLVLLAQGQLMASLEQGPQAVDAAYVQHTVRWRSQCEAAKVLAGLKQQAAAVKLLMEALKSAQLSPNPMVVLEALLEIGATLRPLDAPRARITLELALQLAGNLHQAPRQELARSLLASVTAGDKSSHRPAEARPAAVKPAAVSVRTSVAPTKGLRRVGLLSSEPHEYACPTLRSKSVLAHLEREGALEQVILGTAQDGQFQLVESGLQRCDVIVVQRQMAAVLPYAELRKKLSGHPAKIVFEIDDALTALPEWHRAASAFRSIQPQIMEYLREADLVTVSTPRLRSLYAPLNRNIVVLPNSVDQTLWPASAARVEPRDKITILFSGTLDHERDLQVVESALLDLLAAYPDRVEFLYWGNVTERLRALPQVQSAGEFLPNYHEYAARLQKLPASFAIVPLEDHAFNRAKSSIKWLEYSSRRLPGIYSDLAAYNETVENGRTGLLVPNTREAWFNAMKLLVEEPALRQELATRAQEAVLARHTVQQNARLWLRAYDALFAPAERTPVAPGVAQVSLVIPVFNRLELTRQCLKALEKNTRDASAEVIVVDNGSTDGTAVFLKSEEAAGRLRTILNSENLGFAKACNQGAKAARGQYVLFLNNDTEVQPGWLAPLVSLAEADTNIAAVGSKLLFPDGTIQHAGVAICEAIGRDPLLAVHTFYKAAADLPEANQRRAYQALTAACLLVRRSGFEAVGGFDEGFWNGYEDVDLCFRLQEKGWLMVYEPASVVIHHESQSGPARFQKVQENIQRLHQKWLGKVKVDVVTVPDGTTRPTTTTRIRPYTPGAAETGLTSIVILGYNQLAHTQKCLESLARHTPEPHEIIVVDNGSTDGSGEFLKTWQTQSRHHVLICNRTNQGFAAGNNQGLAVARGEWVVLLNNDTVVTEGWLAGMLAVLQEHPRTGVVGPMSNYVSGPQLVPQVTYSTLAELPDFAGRWNREHAGQSLEVPRAVGFCLLATRSLLGWIGGLDERFGSGNFEDDDFCIRAQLAGFGIRIAQSVFIHHTGSQTFKGANIDYRQAMLRNWGLFKTKWGMPADLSLEQGYQLPTALPNSAPLRVPLPSLAVSHQTGAEGRSWSERPPQASKAAPITLPPCALQGHVGEARQLFRQKRLPAAWEKTLAALQVRPFHPEAFLLLAEIALAAGNGEVARRCAQHARDIAPDFKPARQFLKGKLRGNAKPQWLVLPETLTAKDRAPRLSVCLIAKNEEPFLGRCLASVKGLADQIVLVDTGSTDRTVEIAQEHGAEVHSFPWTDDFSAARNSALEHVTGDWVLVLDADEELPPESHAALGKLIRAAAVMAWRLPIIDVGQEEEGRSYVPRLFRNAPALFFVGRVHEQVFSSIEVRRQEWGLDNRLGDAPLRHYGYTAELVKDRDKVARNLRLLEKAIEELPDEPSLIMNYGLELTRSGDRLQGLEQYRRAFQLMGSQPPALVVPELRESLLTQLATQLTAGKHFDELIGALTSPLARHGGLTASLHFSLGLALIETRQFAEAAEQMRQCLAKRSQPALSPVNKEIRKAGPAHCLALCLSQLQDQAGAGEAFRQAMAQDPASGPVRADYARFLAQQNQPVEALQLFHALAAERPDEVSVWLAGGQVALSRPEFLEVALDWTAEAALKHPQNPAILTQRAESLLLAGRAEEAVAAWRQTQPENNPVALGALVLCETASHQNSPPPPAHLEPSVSQEFLRWYQRLVQFGAGALLTQVNGRLDTLRAILPSAASVLTAALAEANPAP